MGRDLGMHERRLEFLTAAKLRDWAMYRESLDGILRISTARHACAVALNAAEKEGREFTPIYWYYVDMKTTPVMTLWEMNDS